MPPRNRNSTVYYSWRSRTFAMPSETIKHHTGGIIEMNEKQPKLSSVLVPKLLIPQLVARSKKKTRLRKEEQRMAEPTVPTAAYSKGSRPFSEYLWCNCSSCCCYWC